MSDDEPLAASSSLPVSQQLAIRRRDATTGGLPLADRHDRGWRADTEGRLSAAQAPS